jgi:hypothetical protein
MNQKMTSLNLAARLGLLFVLPAGLAACGGEPLDPSSGYGPNPVLPTPQPPIIPVLNPPNAIGWDDGDAPLVAEGLQVTAFASGWNGRASRSR